MGEAKRRKSLGLPPKKNNIKNKVESIVKAKLTEGTEVSSNSMKALNNNPENAVIANNIKKIA